MAPIAASTFGSSLVSALGLCSVGPSWFPSLLLLLLLPADSSLFLFGLVTWVVFLGGDLVSVFSCVFCAELCVGLIILDRKLSSGAFVPARLVRGFALGCSIVLVPAGRDARIPILVRGFLG